MRNLDLQNMFSDYRAPSDGQQALSLSRISPNPQQHRRFMLPQALEALTESVRQRGVLQPLIVREIQDDTYQIIAGHRRYEAAKRAGLEAVPVVIHRDMSDEQAHAMALIENLQREDINPYEQVRGMLDLLKLALGGTEVDTSDNGLRNLIDRVSRADDRGVQGLSEATVARTKQIFGELGVGLAYFRKKCAVLDFPPGLLAALQEGAISFAVARVLAGVEDRSKRARLLDLAKRGASAQELTKLLKEARTETSTKLASRYSQLQRSFAKTSPLITRAIEKDVQAEAELEPLILRLEGIMQELEEILRTDRA
jgi:ParB family chromosome partitioning protein